MGLIHDESGGIYMGEIQISQKVSLKAKVGHFAHKVVGSITTLLSVFVACYPLRKVQPYYDAELQDLPDEMILHIISHCDFSTKMNMRAVNRRIHDIVDGRAHAFHRRNIVGGVEIHDENETSMMPSTSTAIVPMYTKTTSLTLRRPLKSLEILLPATRLTNIMRHVCVCHSLKLRGVLLDERMASDILDASFRAITDLIVDRVHTVTADTLTKLVQKVYPSNSLHIHTHSSDESHLVVTPDMLNSCPARDITVQSSVSLLHPKFNDDALLDLVLSDVAVRRVVRLPMSAVTHHGINRAIIEFHRTCNKIIDEISSDMLMPNWEVTVFLPRSLLINRSEIIIPAHLESSYDMWDHDIPNKGSFTIKVRVQLMLLCIVVETMK